MTTATHLFRWRRVLALCAASVLLHYAVIDWSAAHLAAAPAAAPATIVAELHGAPPVVHEAGAAHPPAQVQLPSSPVAPRSKVKLPPSAQLTFDVARIDADGTRRAGQAVMDWRHGGGQYRLTVRSELADGAAQELASEGATGAGGIVPRTLSAQRGGKAGTATHFDARRGRITFSASEGSVAMAPGTQDKASVAMQLAGIGRAGGSRPGARIALLVGDEKDAGVLRFVAVGQEDIETPMGRLATWHWSQLPVAGTYKARLDVWLAPGYEWYPVQLRSTEAGGAVTTRTIRAIVPIEAGK